MPHTLSPEEITEMKKSFCISTTLWHK